MDMSVYLNDVGCFFWIFFYQLLDFETALSWREQSFDEDWDFTPLVKQYCSILYLDGLIGRYPQDEAVYKERSPIESVHTLSCPILLLQGDEDKIVPPNQAEIMHQALLKKGIPTCLKIYKGEQHGFRKAENIEDALDSELAFYGRVFGITIPDAIELQIDNM